MLLISLVLIPNFINIFMFTGYSWEVLVRRGKKTYLLVSNSEQWTNMSNVSNITSPVPVRLSVEIVHTFQLYYTPFLVLFGSLGNCISVLVFFSTKLRKLSSSYYLSALAVSDTGVLIFTFTSWLALFDVVIFNEHGLCQLSVYLMQVK